MFPCAASDAGQLLDPMVEAKYILTPVLWKSSIDMRKNIRRAVTASVMEWLSEQSAKRHPYAVCALLQRCAEILIDRGWDMATGEKDFDVR